MMKHEWEKLAVILNDVNSEQAGIVRFLQFNVNLRFPSNEYVGKLFGFYNYLLLEGISKTLLHYQEWSLIIKHNIFCLHWNPVYWSLSIVFNMFGGSPFLARRLMIWSNRLILYLSV